ncbi:hypothetical protein OHA84_38140 (plasmid) [Streptomyces sp. NBC_00513]|uniref:hypothetical protein n=1 Tax=unclassified Streptomyces TaxID=2593676 RepID=UPI0022555B8F|nr:hypothetical protein [Streptomyces sp. NBC_00424]MCX5079167.1 hypothetical protein [Streptomyces sp. NBC_00424]WUD39028.1 hypothetical protein OHA84_00025 [Streptomyces sp. NBC_00513]WUD45701.1 hypothetical protein OHA84_37275 [Streptomyces sp. NBC_00513]WUD46354.1 hypothetical protein OHA84_38140 [Streptomyces sp. NBC_00513]
MPTARTRKFFMFGLAAACAGTLGTAPTVSAAPAPAVSAATPGEMPYAIDNFAYPNAAKIKAETTHLVLKRGNGRLVYTACTGSEDLKIESTEGQMFYCFDVKAKPAFVQLELPSAYGIWTKTDPVKVTIKADDKTSLLDAPANRFTGYGEAGSAGGAVSTLIELRVN